MKEHIKFFHQMYAKHKAPEYLDIAKNLGIAEKAVNHWDEYEIPLSSGAKDIPSYAEFKLGKTQKT